MPVYKMQPTLNGQGGSVSNVITYFDIAELKGKHVDVDKLIELLTKYELNTLTSMELKLLPGIYGYGDSANNGSPFYLTYSSMNFVGSYENTTEINWDTDIETTLTAEKVNIEAVVVDPRLGFYIPAISYKNTDSEDVYVEVALEELLAVFVD